MDKGLSVRDIQEYFGFETPQAIYKWQNGTSLLSVDNLYALSILFGCPMEEILVQDTLVEPLLASMGSNETPALFQDIDIMVEIDGFITDLEIQTVPSAFSRSVSYSDGASHSLTEQITL